MSESTNSGIIHLLILFTLLVVLLGTLVFTGILGCEVIPGGCELYYQIIKQRSPKILIVHGESGLGDIQKLQQVLGDKDILGSVTTAMEVERLTYGNILDYDLVIVERAKKICSDKLKIFQNYVASGGRLVWTADAGTQLCAVDTSGRYSQTDFYLLDNQRNEGGTDRVLGPWARLDNDRQLSFDQFLGVEYMGNYCEFVNCQNETFSGYIEVVDFEGKLTYGLSPQLQFTGDYAVVRASKESDGKIAAVIDNSFDLLGKSDSKPWLESGKQYNFGRKLPFIVTSGTGQRVAYYSTPIEAFVSDEQPGKYKALIEQMYYGMLYK